MNNLLSGNFEAAVSSFDNGLKDDVDAEKLESMHKQYKESYGEAAKRPKVLKTYYDNKHIVYQFLWYGDQSCKLRFETNNDKITAFNMQMEAVTKGWSYPDYADRSDYKTYPELIQCESYALPGEIVMPVKDQHDKFVIFIHGSGPSDRDASVQGNRPFRDLAYGLAAKGIGSIRYEKNTYLFGTELANDKGLTIWDETGKDVVSVVKYLQKFKSIEPENIVLVGHSQGAMMIPRICDSIDVGAAVMIAGNARPLYELMYEQSEFLMGRDGLDDGEKRRLKMLKEQIDNLDKLRGMHPDSVDFALPFGLPAAYWKDLLEYDQRECLRNIDIPVFLIQGEGDYQVSMKDFRRFRRDLRRSDSDWKAKAYDKINHLLFKNKGKPSRSEYSRNENVDLVLIEDISTWIKSL
ncbi:MAG: alpha/beta fold hydrolase [Bacteroidota bacterium]